MSDNSIKSLPSPSRTEKDGIITEIKYRFNEDGKIVKHTITKKLITRKIISTPAAMERRKWSKFGKATGQDNFAVTNVADDVFLERPWEEEMKTNNRSFKPASTEKWKVRKNRVREELKPPTDGKYVPMHKRDGAKRVVTSLKVSNFPLDYTEDELQILFDSVVRVRGVKILTNKRTGKSRGMGFVNLYNEEDTKYAMEQMNGHRMEGLILSVELADY